LAAVEESGYLYVPGDDGDDRPRWRRKRVLLPAGVGVLLLAAVLTVDPDTSDLEATGAVPTLEPGSAEGNQFIGGQDEADTSTSATSDTTPTSDATSTTTSTAATSAPPTTVASSGVGEASSVSTAAAAVESSATAATPASSAAPTTVSATTVSATTVSATTVAAGTTAAPAPDCHPAYSPCIPNRAGDAINCGDLSAAQKPVTVLDPSYDPYRLDADGDGRGCEG
jgi:hypothetical protein